jgi:hypothetical protein
MNPILNPHYRHLLEEPLKLSRGPERVGRSLWLYLYLLFAANHRGSVCRHLDRLADELSVTQKTIEEWLKKLSEAGLIQVATPPPFLVIKLPMWSSKGPDEGSGSSASAQPPYSFQSKLLQTKQLNNSYRAQEGPTGELLGEILSALGETDPAPFTKVVELYAPAMIRQALERVRKAKTIQKNRTALFRYLLPRIAKEEPSDN